MKEGERPEQAHDGCHAQETELTPRSLHLGPNKGVNRGEQEQWGPWGPEALLQPGVAVLGAICLPDCWTAALESKDHCPHPQIPGRAHSHTLQMQAQRRPTSRPGCSEFGPQGSALGQAWPGHRCPLTCLCPAQRGGGNLGGPWKLASSWLRLLDPPPLPPEAPVASGSAG